MCIYIKTEGLTFMSAKNDKSFDNEDSDVDNELIPTSDFEKAILKAKNYGFLVGLSYNFMIEYISEHDGDPKCVQQLRKARDILRRIEMENNAK